MLARPCAEGESKPCRSAVARKPKPKPDDPAQSKRLDHELATDSDKKSFERTFRKIAGVKKKLKPDDPEQSKRFIEAAREYGTDETGEAFERVFKRVAYPKRAPSLGPKPGKKRAS
jgi:hypothetical protein